MREAQVHAVAAEEGARVQRELHAGRVGDGLTQQRHHCGRRRRASKRTDVTRAVEHLEGKRGRGQFLQLKPDTPPPEDEAPRDNNSVTL